MNKILCFHAITFFDLHTSNKKCIMLLLLLFNNLIIQNLKKNCYSDDADAFLFLLLVCYDVTILKLLKRKVYSRNIVQL